MLAEDVIQGFQAITGVFSELYSDAYFVVRDTCQNHVVFGSYQVVLLHSFLVFWLLIGVLVSSSLSRFQLGKLRHRKRKHEVLKNRSCN